MEIQLSKDFKLSEFLKSETARKHGINNSYISYVIVNNLQSLVTHVLQPLRDAINIPIRINSGYRSSLLNKRLNGAKNSQHMFGYAADITCSDNLKALKLLQTMNIDQLIVYGDTLNPRFIHVSYNAYNPAYNRHQYLTYP